MTYKFAFDMPPIVQQRARKGAHGNFYDPSKADKKLLAWEMLKQKALAGMPLLTKELALEVVFHGLPQGDLDNAIKALSDAGNGILWKDDKQITAIEANVIRKSNRPHTVLAVREIEGR